MLNIGQAEVPTKYKDKKDKEKDKTWKSVLLGEVKHCTAGTRVAGSAFFRGSLVWSNYDLFALLNEPTMIFCSSEWTNLDCLCSDEHNMDNNNMDKQDLLKDEDPTCRKTVFR